MPSPADKTQMPSTPADSIEPTESLLQSLLRAVSSVFEPTFTDVPTSGDAGGPLVLTWEAHTAVGPGAFPVPGVADTPIVGGPGYSVKDPASNFPWKSIYLAGTACDGPLPEMAPRKHQVIVMQRGECAFSEKLDNIPSFSQGRNALQMVIVVDEGGADDEGLASPLRPLLETEQLTPKGMRRLHGVPMVLMDGAPGDYELFGRAGGVGMRRKYWVKSQGLRVENAVVL